MSHLRKFFLIAILFLCTGCYPGINGKVVDAVTGKPIAGAVVLAQFTGTRGLPGLSYHVLVKIEETETDNDGKFYMSGVYHPFVSQPELVIYKKGYVPWRNDMDFYPNWKKYDKNIWEDNMTYRLEYVKQEHSKRKLRGYLTGGIIGINQTVPKFSNIASELNNEAYNELHNISK